jgi:hypothetical protein
MWRSTMLIELFLQVSENASSHTHPNGWLDPIIADRQLSHSMQTSSLEVWSLNLLTTTCKLVVRPWYTFKKPTTRLNWLKELQYILTQETTVHTNQQAPIEEIFFLLTTLIIFCKRVPLGSIQDVVVGKKEPDWAIITGNLSVHMLRKLWTR